MQAISTAIQTISEFVPQSVRPDFERASPQAVLWLSRLALEVMQAEADGLPYAEAAERPDYPLMSRVHFGARDLLQHRLSPDLREYVVALAEAAEAGLFEDTRRNFFLAARASDDLEAALARFLLYEAVRINLLVGTWDAPEVEASGALAKLDTDAQVLLDDALGSVEFLEEDTRPLHVLVAEAMLVLKARVDDSRDTFALHLSATVERLHRLTDAMSVVRTLGAPDAAVLRGLYPDALGSQRLADRYPWHFPSANAVDQRRSRLRGGATPVSDRFIDVLRNRGEEDDQ
jgi:hypothetical protein